MARPTKRNNQTNQLLRWKNDICAFITEALVDPDTLQPFTLFPEQIDFLKRGFTIGANGRLPFSELLYSCPKRSGKTTLNAWCVIWCTAIADKRGLGICVANDFDQSRSRALNACHRLLVTSPYFKDSIKVTNDKITFANGAEIIAIAADAAGSAGSSASIISVEETWAMVSENSKLLLDELIPVPTKAISCRLTTSYAGYQVSGGSPLESLRERGLTGTAVAPFVWESPGMLMAWYTKPIAPWQTPEWLAEMKRTLRPIAYSRLIENRFVGMESQLLSSEMIEAVTRHDIYPLIGGKNIRAFCGIDLSLRSDHTAIILTHITPSGKIRLLNHVILRPDAKHEIDIGLVERLVLDYHRRFALVSVFYDPWQCAYLASELSKKGVPMEQLSQTPGNLSEASSALYDAIKNKQIELYPADEIRDALFNCTARENVKRGTWHISKETASKKVDAAVALSFSVLACMKYATRGAYSVQEFGFDHSEEQAPAPYFLPANSMSAAHTKENSFRAKHGRDPIPLTEAELNGCFGSTQYRNQWVSRGDFLSNFSPEEREAHLTKNPANDSDFGDGTPPGGPDWGFCPGEDLLRDAMHAAANRGPSRLEWRTQPLSR